MEAGFPTSREGVWSYFSSLVSDKLHVSISLSPVGDKLRNRCRNFPALVNNMTIDWCFPWPQQALLSVASNFIPREVGKG